MEIEVHKAAVEHGRKKLILPAPLSDQVETIPESFTFVTISPSPATGKPLSMRLTRSPIITRVALSYLK